MKTVILSHLIIFFLTCAATGQEKLKEKGLFPVMSWGGVSASEVSPESYRKLREVGVNIDIAFLPDLTTAVKALNAAREAGLRLMISCPELKSDPGESARLLKDHPALEGYYLADEPGKSLFHELALQSSGLRSADSRHYSFVNLYPNINSNQGKFGTKDYREYVLSFDSLFPAPFLSFDFYPVVDGALHPRWFENLEFFSELSRTRGRPFWAFALTTSYLAYSDDSGQPSLNDFYQLYQTYRPEKIFVHGILTLGELRLQVFANLAYGAQGIEYWRFRGFGSPLDSQGKRTDVFDRVQQVSREIQNLSGVFLGARVISVAHTGIDIPAHTRRLYELPPEIHLLETFGQGAIVSILENGENTFLVVVNRDFKNPMKLILSTGENVKKVLKDGSLVPASDYANVTETEPGDVQIFMFPARK